jgi:cell wall-associated NlpC family hydrolase
MPTTLRSRVPLLCLVAALVAAAAFPATASSSELGPPPWLLVTPPPPTPPTKAERAARLALGEVGVPYRWGGESPETGFDCSGLVRWAYLRVGVDLPHNSYALYGQGRRVSEARMAPGDILFFEGLGHVGLYLGRGRMVHAPETGRNVEVVRLAGSNYGSRLVGARRVVVA